MVTGTVPDFLVHWEDEVAHVRRRDSALGAVVLHMGLLLVLLVNPKFFAAQELAQQQGLELAEQQLTVLYLPSDLAAIPEPQTPPNLTPEERRRAVIRSPLTVDPRELQRILLPPAPTAPLGGGAEPASPGRAPGSEGQPGGPEQPEEKKQVALLELKDLPRPQSPGPAELSLERTSPGRAIEESLRRGQGKGKAGDFPGDIGTPLAPNLNTPFPLILSDTRGVDFAPYLIRLLRDVRRNWYAVIPESVRWGEQGKVVIVFSIQKDGAVPLGQPKLAYSSGRSHLDRPALAAIRGSQPFPPLPAEFTGDRLVLQFTFLYNLPVDYTGP